MKVLGVTIKTDTPHILALGIVLFGIQLILGVFVLVPVQAACISLPTCSLLNLNPYLGWFYVLLGVMAYFDLAGEQIRNKRWFLVLIGLIPLLAAFLEFDLTQGGPFGTFRIGGITLEHEGFALGMIPASFFFYRRTRLFQGVVATALLLIFQEYLTNGLTDLGLNPFGVSFSGIIGFLTTYAVFRAFGYKELKG